MREAMKSPAVLHMVSMALQAVVVTKVSSWKENSVGDCLRLVLMSSVELPVVVEEVVREDGKLIRADTAGHKSLINGRKLFSCAARVGNTSMRMVRRERRRYGDGEERWDGMD